MVRIDDARWTFGMKALHTDLLNAILKLCDSSAWETSR